jgi:hypothetical protein
MPSSADLAAWIANYFAANQQRVAEVLAGPKRETWFSAETFVALSHAAVPDPTEPILSIFSCWGEEEFKKMFSKVPAAMPAPTGAQPKRRPDVVCYSPKDGAEAIDAILELKLVLNDENPTAGLVNLKNQLQNARTMAPKAKVLGLTFFAAAPLKTPGTFETAGCSLRAEIEKQMPDNEGFAWVTGHEAVPVFRTVLTRFHYPSMTVSLGLAVRELVT